MYILYFGFWNPEAGYVILSVMELEGTIHLAKTNEGSRICARLPLKEVVSVHASGFRHETAPDLECLGHLVGIFLSLSEAQDALRSKDLETPLDPRFLERSRQIISECAGSFKSLIIGPSIHARLASAS
ncbi:MAG: hypothetical protein WC107_02215 [Patescibacteria group bacterium]